MRLNAYLARAGVASRRRADELIREGRVRVNGEPGELNTYVGQRDVVDVDSQPVELQPLAYVLLHKPAASSRPRATRRDGRRSSTSSTMHRGSSRSAASTSRRPARCCSRTTATSRTGSRTRATASRRSTRPTSRARRRRDDLARLCATGVELDDGPTAPARVQRLGPSRLELTLHEGRKHQVKRMCEAVGHPVRRLHRSPLRGARPRRARARRVARADGERGRGRCGSASASSASLTKPMRSYIASSVGADASRAFSAPSARRRWSSPASSRSSRKRSLDRLEERDDGLGDVRLERPVAGAVIARSGHRQSTRPWRRS